MELNTVFKAQHTFFFYIFVIFRTTVQEQMVCLNLTRMMKNVCDACVTGVCKCASKKRPQPTASRDKLSNLPVAPPVGLEGVSTTFSGKEYI